MQRFVILSGYNQRAIIAFMRTLENKKIPYSVIAYTSDDPILNTDYKKKVEIIRNTNNLDSKNFLAWIEFLQEKYISDQFIILPSSEYLNRFMLKHKVQIETYQVKIPLVNESLYEKISNKDSFESLCMGYDIAVPERIQQITFPCIAKPRNYFSALGGTLSPVIIRDSFAYHDFLKKYHDNDFYFQRYIKGESIYLLCYFYANGEADVFAQRNLLQQDDGKSIIAAEYSDFWKQPEARKYIKLFQENCFQGLIMIEIRKEDNTYYMIEANPRLWGPSQFMVDSNANLFESMLFDLNLINNKPNIRNSYLSQIKYFWKNGILEDIKRGKSPLLLDQRWTISNMIREFKKYDIYRRQDTCKLYDISIVTNLRWRED